MLPVHLSDLNVISFLSYELYFLSLTVDLLTH